MDISGLDKISASTYALGDVKKEEKTSGKVFDDFYKAAMGMINNTNDLQKKAEETSINFAMGKIDNIHSVAIAEEKANIALQFTVQIRNQVLDAYQEIMRMQL